MIITNGSTISINQLSNMPNVSDALSDWLIGMTARIVTSKTLVDFRETEITTDSSVWAVIQPFSARQLLIKPEGQRQWQWYALWVKPQETFINSDGSTIYGSNFNLDDIIYFNEIRYRIMQKNEWGINGFYNYDVIRDYTGNA